MTISLSLSLKRDFSNFMADRPKAALLLWFVGDFFRCGVLLFMVLLVIYKYNNALTKMISQTD